MRLQDSYEIRVSRLYPVFNGPQQGQVHKGNQTRDMNTHQLGGLPTETTTTTCTTVNYGMCYLQISTLLLMGFNRAFLWRNTHHPEQIRANRPNGHKTDPTLSAVELVTCTVDSELLKKKLYQISFKADRYMESISFFFEMLNINFNQISTLSVQVSVSISSTLHDYTYV